MGRTRDAVSAYPLGSGDVAVVTGGASGIGLRAVERFAQRGAKVAVVDLNPGAAQAALAAAGSTVYQCDVSDREALDAVFADISSTLGPPKVVFANAGIHAGAADPFTLDGDAIETMLNVNVKGVVWTIGAARPHTPPGGHIVVTASLSGAGPYTIDPLYSATKHAVVGFVRSLAPLLQSEGIVLSAIAPGIVDTPLVGEDVVELLKSVNFDLLSTDDVIDALDVALTEAQPGACYISLPGMEPVPYRFRGLPGARVPLDDSSAPL